MPSPSAGPALIRRRDMLLGTAGLALLTVTATACGAGPPAVDPLQAQLDLADADATLARAAAAAAAPPLVPGLTQIASERSDHARALAREIARAAGQPDPATTTTTAVATTPDSTTVAPPTVKDVVAALRHSAERAGALAGTESGFRAGLLGSIAASCTASFAVTLNAPVIAR